MVMCRVGKMQAIPNIAVYNVWNDLCVDVLLTIMLEVYSCKVQVLGSHHAQGVFSQIG